MTYRPVHLVHPKKILQKSNRFPRRSLGQNFLVNKGILEKIADAVSENQSHTVVEVGPGLGHLTVLLCELYNNVVAIEKDDLLAKDLQDRLKEYDNLTVISQDGINISIEEIIHKFTPDYDVVGNLPFYCATEILFNFLETETTAQKIIFMFQREVAARLVAKAGTKEYGALTIACDALSDVKPLFKIKAGSFYPKPDVDAEVLCFKPKSEKDRVTTKNRVFLRKILRAAFSARRKTLKNALKNSGIWDDLIKSKCGCFSALEKIRPDAIKPSDYFTMAKALAAKQRDP